LSSSTRNIAFGNDSSTTPLTSIVQAACPVRDPGHDPLFQAGFTMRPPMRLEVPGLEVTPYPVHNGGAQLDLFATVWEDGGTVRGMFEYDAALWSDQTARRMISHLEVLLAGATDRPDRPVSRLPILSEQDRRQFAAWNDTKVEYPADCLLHELFEAQVRLTPDAPAVEFDHQRLTYRQLNERANQLAHHLRKTAVGAETMVGVCLDR
jgi:non-ribosomal peptide synthetase component F